VLAADAMATLAAATILLTLVAELAMPWLMYAMNPGYAVNPAKFKLTILLTQITMPYLPCMAIYAHLSGCCRRAGGSSCRPARRSCSTSSPWPRSCRRPRPTARRVAGSWGVIVAGLLQAGLLWWGVRALGRGWICAGPG